ncbi:MAG: Gfo/Idh/MocA family oxidoreductase [Opitutaceae bacterium]|nr:Gfo/Idh/MocA family oxidoreductase [Opitutaceae bacterium]
MTRPLRIGLVGAGANTRERHIPGFRAMDGVEIVVVANRSEASSRTVAAEFGIPRIAVDWRAVVADANVDAICIGTWPYLHAEITLAALAVGKHVLTEARMARNASEGSAMLGAARARPELVVQIVPSPLTLPVDAMIRRMIADGELGAVREICVTHTMGAYADGSAPMTWRLDYDLSGHNSLTLGIYYEAVLRWMQEDARVDSASALIATSRRIRADGTVAEVKLPESLTVLGRYANGARLIMHLSGLETTAPRNVIRINGEKGCLRLDVAQVGLHWCPVGGKETPVVIPQSERGGWNVEADFVHSGRTGAPVRLTDFATGLRTMRFTDEVWRAWNRAAV